MQNVFFLRTAINKMFRRFLGKYISQSGRKLDFQNNLNENKLLLQGNFLKMNTWQFTDSSGLNEELSRISNQNWNLQKALGNLKIYFKRR